MAKKRNPTYTDYDDELDGIGLNEFEITEICGDVNAQKGRALYGRGTVIQRSFDGQAIHATIQTGTSNLPVVLDLYDLSGSCSDQQHLRQGEFLCDHIAALMYAYFFEPETFLPQNIGDFINLLDKNPQVSDQLAASDPPSSRIIEQIQNVPLGARAAFENLPITVTPQQLAAAPSPMDELKSRLRILALEQLHEIAKRRGLKITENAKELVIKELATWLASMPLPAELSSEEDQLLRTENTLYGLGDIPSAQSLDTLWHARTGGDVTRPHRAARGLQSAGVMFPCTENRSALHYHWSPFLRSENTPLLTSKTKLYPLEKIERLTQAEPMLPLTALADAVIELAEREPMRVRLYTHDPRWANQAFAQNWDLDPQEMDQFAKTRFFPNNAVTIPFLPFWSDETLGKLDVIAPEIAKWIATVFFSAGVFTLEGEQARLDPGQVHKWRAQSEETHWQIMWDDWRAGAVALTELRIAAERASLVVQRPAYDQNFKPGDLMQEIGRARSFVARVLAPLDPLTWYSFKSLAEYVRGLRADFLHTFIAPQTWFFAASKTRHRFDPNNVQNWDSSYRAVLATILDTTLRWTGVTQVAYEGKELAAFRITALGASLLSGGKVNLFSEPADPNAPWIIWVDDATMRLRATPDAARAMPLIRAIADTTRESLIFRISNASITRAFERGMTVAEIADKFVEMNAPLPVGLRERLDALAANYGRVHGYEHLTVIELADDFALRELLASTSLTQFVVHQFSPRLVVVRDQGVDEWVNEIVKKGYTPRVMTTEPMNQ